MSKTKFTKVAVEERLPEEIDTNTVFLTKEGNVRIFYNKKYLKDYEPNYEEDELEYFLEESPDREDEMIEMLEEGIAHLTNWIMNVEALIQSIKHK